MYQHPIGLLSRGAVLDVGLKCTHSCRFCYYSYLDHSDNQFSGMRHAKFRTLEECKEILRLLKSNNFLNFDYTGGEPALHPDIIEITRYAHQDLGLKGRMITLGQFLMRRMPNCRHDRLIEDLLDAGLTNFLFSVHAVDEALFHRITSEQSGRQREAMRFLDERGFQYTSNTTVFEWNYKHLPEIARAIVGHRVYLHNFIIMNAYYEWNRAGRAFGVQARYADIAPYLREAIDILEAHQVGVNIRYAPLCVLRGMERHLVGMVGVRYDPYEWMNQAGHFGGPPKLCAAPLPVAQGQIDPQFAYRAVELRTPNGQEINGMRGKDVKHFAAPCRDCRARQVCDGIDPNYLQLYGTDEFTPYTEGEWVAPVHAQRAGYLPAFVVKTEQYENMQQAVRLAFEKMRAPALVEAPAPAVSVVITCYNYGRYLPYAVASVAAQTYPDWEMVIVDDGSTDETSAVIESVQALFPGRVRAVRQANSGQPALARNSGIAAARGRYILCLDADDMIASTMLEQCVRLLDDDPAVAIAYTDRQDFDGATSLVQAGDYDFARLRYNNQISYCALFRREAWDSVGGYRDNVRGCEDWDFWVALGAKGFYGKRIAQPLFYYRRHDTGVYQDALRNMGRRAAQIVLNNAEVYERQDIERAKGILSGKVQASHAASQPLVSVIIPTYNRPGGLRRALASVARQTYKAVEVVVVNDAGQPVEAVLNEFRGQLNIKHVRHESNRDRAAARNTGIRHASGKYIAYLDDDDCYYPEHLQTAVDALLSSRHKVVYTDAVRAYHVWNGTEYRSQRYDIPYSLDYCPGIFLATNITPILCVVHEKACLEAIGLFDEALPVLEDWDLWIRLSQKYDFYHVRRATCEFSWRTDGTSTTGQKQDEFVRVRGVLSERYSLSQTKGVVSLPPTWDRPIVSIIILCHNALEHTKRCLGSLQRNTSAYSFEVILVDNASTDGTADYLRAVARNSPNCRLILNRENRGFAAGNNQGLSLAQGDYVLLLNNDTLLPPGWLERMIAVMQTYPQTGIVGPMSNCVSGPQLVPSVPYKTQGEMEAFAARWATAHAGKTVKTMRVVGFCLLARRTVVDRIGGLDERFGSGNFEDDDFCVRAALAGYEARIAQDSFVHHTGSQTFRAAGIDFAQSIERNWTLFKAKWEIPAATPLNSGYSITINKPDPTRLSMPLPDLAVTHRLSPDVRCWEEKSDVAAAEQAVRIALGAGQAALEAGNFELAVEEFTRVTDRFAGLAAGWTALGSTLMALDRPTEAASALRRSLDLVPGEAALLNQLGVALYRAGEVEEAEQVFRDASKANSKDVGPLLNLIELYQAQGLYAEATATVNEALAIDPDNADVLLSFGTLSLLLGDQEGAQIALRRLERVQPAHPGVAALQEVLACQQAELANVA